MAVSVYWSLVFYLAAFAASTECRLLYVSPTSPAGDSCPGSEPCLTLDEYITSSNDYITSDTVFKFLPGRHDITRPFVARFVKNITLEGAADGDTNPLVELLHSSGRRNEAAFIFSRSSDINMTGIDAAGFGLYFERTERFSLTRITVSNVAFTDGIVLHGARRGLLRNVSVHNSTGHGIRLIGTTQITAQRLFVTLTVSHGIYLVDTVNTFMNQVLVDQTGGSGLLLQGAQRTNLTHCLFYNSQLSGMTINDTTFTSLSFIRISNSSSNGLTLNNARRTDFYFMTVGISD